MNTSTLRKPHPRLHVKANTRNEIFVLNDRNIQEQMNDLRMLCADQEIPIRDITGRQQSIPTIDFFAMFDYVMADMDLLVKGSINPTLIAEHYIRHQILERDDEYNEVLKAITHYFASTLASIRDTIRLYKDDYHDNHTYILIEIFATGGLVIHRETYPD